MGQVTSEGDGGELSRDWDPHCPARGGPHLRKPAGKTDLYKDFTRGLLWGTKGQASLRHSRVHVDFVVPEAVIQAVGEKGIRGLCRLRNCDS